MVNLQFAICLSDGFNSFDKINDLKLGIMAAILIRSISMALLAGDFIEAKGS